MCVCVSLDCSSSIPFHPIDSAWLMCVYFPSVCVGLPPVFIFFLLPVFFSSLLPIFLMTVCNDLLSSFLFLLFSSFFEMVLYSLEHLLRACILRKRFSGSIIITRHQLWSNHFSWVDPDLGTNCDPTLYKLCAPFALWCHPHTVAVL